MLSRGCIIVGSYGASSFLFYRNELESSLLFLSFLNINTFLQALFWHDVFCKTADEYYPVKAQSDCR